MNLGLIHDNDNIRLRVLCTVDVKFTIIENKLAGCEAINFLNLISSVENININLMNLHFGPDTESILSEEASYFLRQYENVLPGILSNFAFAAHFHGYFPYYH